MKEAVPDVPVGGGVVAVTVIFTVTVFAGDELSLTVTLVVSAATPVTVTVGLTIDEVATAEFGAVRMKYGAVPPLNVTVAVDPFATVTEFGVAIMLATVTGTLTVAAPALSFTTIVALPTARPTTVSVAPLTVALTFVVSEFDFTEYGIFPPEMVTNAVPLTSSDTDVGAAVNPPVSVPAPTGLLSDLLQLATNNIALATTTVNAIEKVFFMIMMTSLIIWKVWELDSL